MRAPGDGGRVGVVFLIRWLVYRMLHNKEVCCLSSRAFEWRRCACTAQRSDLARLDTCTTCAMVVQASA